MKERETKGGLEPLSFCLSVSLYLVYLAYTLWKKNGLSLCVCVVPCTMDPDSSLGLRHAVLVRIFHLGDDWCCI